MLYQVTGYPSRQAQIDCVKVEWPDIPILASKICPDPQKTVRLPWQAHAMSLLSLKLITGVFDLQQYWIVLYP
ncbi:MAG: hypothetical protein RL657_624 [Pseudomonadota bacterium]|jgi:hypothetical protein